LTRILKGERIGRQGRLRVGCSAALFDSTRQKVLLTRRTDNGLWCLPGGGMDAGESAAETCEREMLEETGLVVRVVRLVGVYTSPHWLIEYPDGTKVQVIAMNFEVKLLDGEMVPTSEVSEFGYFSLSDLPKLELMQNHLERITDAFAMQNQAFVR